MIAPAKTAILSRSSISVICQNKFIVAFLKSKREGPQDTAFYGGPNGLVLTSMREVLASGGPRQTPRRLVGNPCIHRSKSGNGQHPPAEPQHLNPSGTGLEVEICVGLPYFVCPTQVGLH